MKILGKVRPHEETEHYTLDEAQRIIAALHERTDSQLVMALSFFLGLRPGEIAGVRWEDFDKGWVHIQRAVVRGVIGPTKTPESVAMLPLIAPVQAPLRTWHEKSERPKEGWVFPNRVGDPIDLRELGRRVIVPILKKAKIEWKGLYAGRRGGATLLVALTGNALAAQGLLRHSARRTNNDGQSSRPEQSEVERTAPGS